MAVHLASPDDWDALRDADAAVTMTLPQAVDAPKLRLIQVPAIGVDGIQSEFVPATASVCNAGAHETSCVEYALLGMLELEIQLRTADQSLRNGSWSRSARFSGRPSGELSGKRLLVVGLGGIRRAIAKRAAAFDMDVVAVNRTVRFDCSDVSDVIPLSHIREHIGRMDYVVLCCALTEKTRHLFDGSILSAMRDDAVIVNVARGDIIEETALWEALSACRLGGAVLDVWWNNPVNVATPTMPSRYPFETIDNVLMSPHIAGWSEGTRRRRTEIIAGNLNRLSRGEPLMNRVVF